MRSGKLDRSVTLWRWHQVGTNTYNEPIMDWAQIRSLRATVIPLTADERFGADQVFAVRTLTFRTRWVPDLATTDVIGFEGSYFDITGVAEIGRRRGHEITATHRAGLLEGVG